MNNVVTAGLGLLAIGAVWAVFEFPMVLLGRRGQERLKGAVGFAIVGVMLLSPPAFTRAVNWIAQRKTKEIQEQIEEILPLPPSTTAPVIVEGG